MDRNYLVCFDKVKKELSSWKHRFLTVFGKITVIKTMCIPKFTHIATVIPNLCLGCIKNIEREFEIFLNDKNPSVKTNKTMSYMTKNDDGLGMIKIHHFWQSIKMSCIRRLPSSKSTWAELHKAKTKPHTYNPINTNWVDIETVRTKLTNPV